MKPTKEQEERFWEGCGLVYHPLETFPEEETAYEGGIVCRQPYWEYPDGSTHQAPPDLTGIEALGNLFLHAVPVYKFHYGGEALYKLLVDWACKVSLSREEVNPALALYCVLDKEK
ncbi:hypothetical protein LCGC14_0406360 [marine sediment metagenome]|uniref:Uncharacterized protein n=1 Tax=marine sediment metagenome TaxID=412755 RepID=A0A0F9TDH0_9ZZZZ